MKRALIWISAAAVLAACGNASSSYESGSSSSYSSGGGEVSAGDYSGESESIEEREPFDEDAAREAAEQSLASEGYDYSYGCTDDCSGHDAGWQWRAENGYAADGNSLSFSEGTTAFDEALENRVEEMRSDYDAGLNPDY